jgi:tetratricopeptide (TPR) repeat protein
MLELLVVITFFGYIYYLRNYADLRSKSEKEEAAFKEGITLQKSGLYEEAYSYFDARVKEKRSSAIAYLYRGLSEKGRQNRAAAFSDIQTAVSLDDEVFRAHLELGKMHLEDGNIEAALSAFNKAVSKAGETSPEAYHWRGQAYLKAARDAEASQDFGSEKRLMEVLSGSKSSDKITKKPFFDKKLIISSGMVLFTSGLVIAVIKDAESIHLPYIVAVFSALIIGFTEPYKGWLLALLQCILILTGYFLFTAPPDNEAARELENFSLYGSVILTFVASFLGGFMKRALNMQ